MKPAQYCLLIAFLFPSVMLAEATRETVAHVSAHYEGLTLPASRQTLKSVIEGMCAQLMNEAQSPIGWTIAGGPRWILNQRQSVCLAFQGGKAPILGNNFNFQVKQYSASFNWRHISSPDCLFGFYLGWETLLSQNNKARHAKSFAQTCKTLLDKTGTNQKIFFGVNRTLLKGMGTVRVPVELTIAGHLALNQPNITLNSNLVPHDRWTASAQAAADCLANVRTALTVYWQYQQKEAQVLDRYTHHGGGYAEAILHLNRYLSCQGKAGYDATNGLFGGISVRCNLNGGQIPADRSLQAYLKREIPGREIIPLFRLVPLTAEDSPNNDLASGRVSSDNQQLFDDGDVDVYEVIKDRLPEASKEGNFSQGLNALLKNFFERMPDNEEQQLFEAPVALYNLYKEKEKNEPDSLHLTHIQDVFSYVFALHKQRQTQTFPERVYGWLPAEQAFRCKTKRQALQYLSRLFQTYAASDVESYGDDNDQASESVIEMVNLGLELKPSFRDTIIRHVRGYFSDLVVNSPSDLDRLQRAERYLSKFPEKEKSDTPLFEEEIKEFCAYLAKQNQRVVPQSRSSSRAPSRQPLYSQTMSAQTVGETPARPIAEPSLSTPSVSDQPPKDQLVRKNLGEIVQWLDRKKNLSTYTKYKEKLLIFKTSKRATLLTLNFFKSDPMLSENDQGFLKGIVDYQQNQNLTYLRKAIEYLKLYENDGGNNIQNQDKETQIQLLYWFRQAGNRFLDFYRGQFEFFSKERIDKLCEEFELNQRSEAIKKVYRAHKHLDGLLNKKGKKYISFEANEEALLKPDELFKAGETQSNFNVRQHVATLDSENSHYSVFASQLLLDEYELVKEFIKKYPKMDPHPRCERTNKATQAALDKAHRDAVNILGMKPSSEPVFPRSKDIDEMSLVTMRFTQEKNFKSMLKSLGKILQLHTKDEGFKDFFKPNLTPEEVNKVKDFFEQDEASQIRLVVRSGDFFKTKRKDLLSSYEFISNNQVDLISLARIRKWLQERDTKKYIEGQYDSIRASQEFLDRLPSGLDDNDLLRKAAIMVSHVSDQNESNEWANGKIKAILSKIKCLQASLSKA